MKKMAKMVNPNTVTDMALVNARAQMKTQQLLQKVGKGKRKVQVTLSKNVRGYLSTMTKEMKKQIKTQLGNEKQLANLFQFFNYFEKETEVIVLGKKIKQNPCSQIQIIFRLLKRKSKTSLMKLKKLWERFLLKSGVIDLMIQSFLPT